MLEHFWQNVVEVSQKICVVRIRQESTLTLRASIRLEMVLWTPSEIKEIIVSVTSKIEVLFLIIILICSFFLQILAVHLPPFLRLKMRIKFLEEWDCKNYLSKNFWTTKCSAAAFMGRVVGCFDHIIAIGGRESDYPYRWYYTPRPTWMVILIHIKIS